MEIILSYIDIFMLGWNLNALMFVVNLLLAMKILNSSDPEALHEQNETLHELKEEFDKLYPNRKYEALITYAIPFTAFFRSSYRIIEMVLFFNKNQGSKMFDYMVYKYQSDINRIKNN